MKIAFTIGTTETIEVVIKRNCFTGRFTCTANGQVHILKTFWNPSAHFSTRLTNVYTVEVGTREKQLITIEHKRPLFVAGFRPQEYKVTVDGKVVSEYRGY